MNFKIFLKEAHFLRRIVVGTRSSELALTQTKMVIKQLQHTGVASEFDIKTISTKGDRNLNVALSKVGGKGIFSTDIQKALQENEIDFAVHSLKDLPLHNNEFFCLASFPKREDHRDAYIGRTNIPLDRLQAGAVIGTSSARRAAFIHSLYPHLRTESIRGPVNMRLEQLRMGKYDGIILAVAGLKRLNLTEVITEYLPADHFIPAVGQGALAIECRSDDEEMIQIVRKINDDTTERGILAEREFARLLDDEDEAPIGAFAQVEGERITLYGSISSLDGKDTITVQAEGNNYEDVAREAADSAFKQGAELIIERAKQELKLR